MNGLTQFQHGHFKCSHRKKNGDKSADAPFNPSWVDDYGQEIVVFASALGFHLKSGEILTTPWKNTAKETNHEQHNTEMKA